MSREERTEIEAALCGVPEGGLHVARYPAAGFQAGDMRGELQVQTAGTGKIETYPIFPGAEASFHTFLATEAAFHHAASGAVLEIYYCHAGRVGWNMHSGMAVYLGAGDLTIHSSVCCADSVMMFPVGYSAGLSIALDFRRLAEGSPELLRTAGVPVERLQERFCGGESTAVPAGSEWSGILAPLYAVPAALRLPYLKLKVQELLLMLSCLPPPKKGLTQYGSQQTELMKEIHGLLTEHLDQRFTIEELARRYLINTSTLKEVFKAVYGLPIATYMKEYRIRRAMELLRETNASIADVAEQVGYESPGKFTKAFKDVARVLPTEYRRYCQSSSK